MRARRVKVAEGIWQRGGRYFAIVSRGRGAGNVEMSFPTQGAAEAWRHDALLALAEGRPLPAAAGYRLRTTTVTFAHAADDWHTEFLENAISEKRSGEYIQDVARIVLFLKGQFRSSRPIQAYSKADVKTQVRDALRHRGIDKRRAGTYLTILRRIFEHAINAGYTTSNPAHGVKALALRDSERRRKPRPVPLHFDLSTAATIASFLAAPYRVAFWIQRLIALRVSEVYGLRIGDFDWDSGTVVIQRQGGRTFYEVGFDDEILAVDGRGRAKTESGTRVLVLPRPLLSLVYEYIESAHHVGLEDLAPETPLLGRTNTDTFTAGTVSGYRAALTRAIVLANAAGVDINLTSHALRKAAHTDVRQIPDIDGQRRAEWMGWKHEAGADRLTSIYTLNSADLRWRRAIAAWFEASIDHHLDGSLDLGASTIERTGDGYTVEEAAKALGRSVATINKMITDGLLPAACKARRPGRAPALLVPANSVIEIKTFWESHLSLAQVAERYDVPKSTAWSWVNKKMISAVWRFGRWWVAEADLDSSPVIADHDRRAHALSLEMAARQLDTTKRRIRQLVIEQRLVRAAIRGSSELYVTRESIEQELGRRQREAS